MGNPPPPPGPATRPPVRSAERVLLHAVVEAARKVANPPPALEATLRAYDLWRARRQAP
jgi:hypothetical protein